MRFNYSYYNLVLHEEDEFVYLYNSFSGALCKLEKDIHNYILNNILDDENKCQHFDELYKQGFIKPLSLNEYNKIILNERIEVLAPSVKKISFVIAPTLACNLNCEYCFESGCRNNKIISDDTLIAIADYILNKLTYNITELHIGWFGGEPMLAFEKILKFNRFIKPRLKEREIKYTASMITNGVLLSEKKLEVLSEECNLKSVQITVDGTQEIYCKRKNATPKQFNDLMNNIKSALRYVKVSIRLNCDGNNYEDLKTVSKQIIEFCENDKNLSLYLAKLVDYLRCGGEQFFSQYDFDNKRIDFDKYICALREKEYKPRIHKYRRFFCGLFKLNNQVIGPNGELYKCEHHVGQEDKAIGNIAYGMDYNDWFMEFINNKPLDRCRICKIFPICLGGCPALKMDLSKGESCFYSEFYIKYLLKNYIHK